MQLFTAAVNVVACFSFLPERVINVSHYLLVEVDFSSIFERLEQS